ncbi:hypothetical protein K1I37_14395 [Alicyclobacillus acidoterrestris]|uniref:Uncharacterized protein n=1 Tax=Alicyclobacillus acidoterrestris (strain ATCC 49025 / DSM 3922 / CIP 106132 / NCIMB 13137 / GD3B) TaxID=1356854 RepID=A0A9E6ZG96_ALIAG|nr:hypothetical protein [Alicyclobacillus acidoterrestris]UNO47868.1 hypothetical protein K1I37_14395 [Alicyclobacillus acidoterrestris]GEO27923.1 hypothetical protein AAC03nite_37080 [Alicyclobacillus acidoterrestris]
MASDYSIYVDKIYQKINSALQVQNVTQAQQLAQTAQQQLIQINRLINKGKTKQAEALILADTTEIAASTSSDTATSGTLTSSVTTSDDLSTHLSNNTVALASALLHVNNPRAQQALEKNIEKGFAHLQSQLQQLGQTPTQTPSSHIAQQTSSPIPTSSTDSAQVSVGSSSSSASSNHTQATTDVTATTNISSRVDTSKHHTTTKHVKNHTKGNSTSAHSKHLAEHGRG